jgi:hypothetical protein
MQHQKFESTKIINYDEQQYAYDRIQNEQILVICGGLSVQSYRLLTILKF